MRARSALFMLSLLSAPALAQAAPSGEARIAEEIAGRVAGEPAKCIDLHKVHSTRIINDTAIIYDAGHTIYVNKPRRGAQGLDSWDILVTKPFGNRICRTDVVQLRDRSSGLLGGLVVLGEFIPYRAKK